MTDHDPVPDDTPDDFEAIVASLEKVSATALPASLETEAKATAFLEASLGRSLTHEESALLSKWLTRRLMFDATEAALDAADAADPAQVLDPFDFVAARSQVAPLWGVGDSRPYCASGEALIIFGGDGTHKTTLAQAMSLGLAGVESFRFILGLEVAPVSGPVLYLALDRPAQAARSLQRFTDRLGTEERDAVAGRYFVLNGSAPTSAGRTPEGLAEYLTDLAALKGVPPWGAVIIDNVSDLYGNLADTDVATLAGQSINRVANSGTEVIALHHPRKRDDRRRPESIEDIYGGRMFTKATGAVIGLYRADTSDGAPLTISHLKAPLGFRAAALAVPNLATGELTRIAVAMSTTTEDEEAAQVAEVLQALGSATIPSLAAEVLGDGSRSPEGMSNREKVRRILANLPEAHGTSEKLDRAQVWEWR